MKRRSIFVEGKEDEAFVKEALSRTVFTKLEGSLVEVCGGWAKLANSSVQKKVDNGDVVLIVFDADDDQRDREFGGNQKRLDAIRKKLGESLFSRVHVFLFPDNRSDGDLETLLEKMVRGEHRAIIEECWAGYQRCLNSKAYNSPTQKSKMREYAAAIDSSVWGYQGYNKAFANDKIWDWSSSALKPLRAFFREKLEDPQGSGCCGQHVLVEDQ